MKATGVVRRIDELGRIVIPKEIRKNFRIKDGENIEIFISDEDSIVLKKISTLNNIENISSILTSVIYDINRKCVIITDMNNIITVDGKEKELFLNKLLSNEYIELLNERKKIEQNNPKKINIVGEDITKAYLMLPIILNGDLVGSIVILSDTNIEKKDDILIDMASRILVKYLEQ